LLSVLLLSCISSHASAIDLTKPINDLTKPIRKATEWVEKRSGLRPTGDNINRAARSAEDAAKSAKQTSDEARTLLLLIKWPLIVSLCLLALLLAGLAIKAWRQALPARQHEQGANVKNPTSLSGRILLISFGSIACFACFYALVPDGSDTFSDSARLLAYVLLSLGASLAFGLLLFWFPVRRIWSCLALGFLSPIASSAATTIFLA